MSRAVFIAVGAFNWNPTNPTAATFKIDPTGAAFTIDSTKRPQGGVNVTNAIVDDHADEDGATSVKAVGSDGGLYIEAGAAAGIGLSLPPVGYDTYDEVKMTQDYHGREYEFITIQYSDDDATYPGYRFYGFHAIWIEGTRNKATLLISHAGLSRDARDEFVMKHTVDLDDRKQVLAAADMPRGALPARGDGAGGGVYLRCPEVHNQELRIPKLPQVLSYSRVPTCPDMVV